MYSGSKPVKCLFPLGVPGERFLFAGAEVKDTLKTPGKGTLTLVPFLGIFRWIAGFAWNWAVPSLLVKEVRQLEC
jgi:hypothetical protein